MRSHLVYSSNEILFSTFPYTSLFSFPIWHGLSFWLRFFGSMFAFDVRAPPPLSPCLTMFAADIRKHHLGETSKSEELIAYLLFKSSYVGSVFKIRFWSSLFLSSCFCFLFRRVPRFCSNWKPECKASSACLRLCLHRVSEMRRCSSFGLMGCCFEWSSIQASMITTAL